MAGARPLGGLILPRAWCLLLTLGSPSRPDVPRCREAWALTAPRARIPSTATVRAPSPRLPLAALLL